MPVSRSIPRRPMSTCKASRSARAVLPRRFPRPTSRRSSTRRTARFASTFGEKAKARRASGPATSRRATSASTRAIGRDMTRRALLLASVAVCFAADPARDSAAVIAGLAASLTAGNAQEFIAAFDRAMPGYDKLRANIAALVQVGETQSYVDVVKNEGDDKS